MLWLQLTINSDAFPSVWIENYDPIVTGRVLTQSIKQTIFCLSLYDFNNGDNSTLTNTGHCACSLHSLVSLTSVQVIIIIIIGLLSQQ